MTMNTIEQAIVDGLMRHPPRSGAALRTTIALSGGVDSMVLLHGMYRIQQGVSSKNAPNYPPIVEFDALHIHHGLSPNADQWAAFCQRECDAREVPLTIVRVAVDRSNTDGQGIEGAARTARYQAFQRHAGSRIVAAQHADDQAETVLHQMLRGTGIAGLAAMGEVRLVSPGQVLLRPLLSISRAEIEAYAALHEVGWIHDESNDDTAITRNFIRHEALPLLATRFPHVAASLTRIARHAAESTEMLDALARIDLGWDGVESTDGAEAVEGAEAGEGAEAVEGAEETATATAAALDGLPLSRQTNALYHWLKWQGVVPPSRSQLESWAAQLFRPSPSDKPHQAGGHDFVIRRQRGKLTLLRRN